LAANGNVKCQQFEADAEVERLKIKA
jgi:hypothetical protein